MTEVLTAQGRETKADLFILFPTINWLTKEFVYSTVSLNQLIITCLLQTWIIDPKVCSKEQIRLSLAN